MTRTLTILAALTLTAACRRTPPEVAKPADPIDRFVAATGVPDEREEAVQTLMENFRRVHFETDSDRLTTDGKAALAANAQILAQYHDIRVEVQGHADERGTVDYNLALGQRRARAVVSYVAGLGVAPSRLPTVSYGEERPLQAGISEVAWSANRRAEFRVLGAATRVQGTTEQ